MRLPLLRLVAAMLAAGGLTTPVAAQDAFPAPVGVRIPLAPTPIPAMGHTILAYELHLSNLAPIELGLSHIDVYLDGSTTPAAVYRDTELAAMRLDPGGRGKSAGTLAAGGFDVIFVWLELGPDVRPSALRHVVVVKAGGGEATVESRINVRPAAEVPVLGPPLRGGPWVMAHGPANPNGHRRSIVTIGGRAAVVQRYGIDYFKIDSAGHTFKGDTARKADYHGYGQDVLAVADALVAVASDAVPENEAPHPSKRAVPINLRTIGGNYIVLDIGQGRYVFYAHLQPGSLRVKAGDKVRKGQVIGALGLTGNTPSPHLHLHVGDTIEPIGSEGLPYLFEAFDVVGECDGPPEMWGWYKQCTFAKPDSRRNELPLAWKLVRFRD
jgi:hypothetical protein